jgi:type II secretory pathway predicted ATPase ExeA/outer membrane protein OmpA-like peptidoglycan-associated protein
MTYMRHALLRAEGFIVITGQPGTGKTTLINDLLQELKTDQVRVARLVSTQLAADDLLRLVAYAFDLNPEGIDKATILNRIACFLEQQHQSGRRTLLIVDEAQDVNEEALEELRLLTNIQIMGHQLLQIFLVGQEELRGVVSAPSLEQLHQRVIAATHLESLSVTETKEYIKHRLRQVGWSGNPMISNQAYSMIHQFSRGIPRQINQICSRLLLHGSIEEKDRLGLLDLKIIIEELHEEMLLPLRIQEVVDSIVWPENLSQEGFDEKLPRPQPVPPAASQTDNGSFALDQNLPSDRHAVTDNPADDRESHGQHKATPPAPPAVVVNEQPDYRDLAKPQATGDMGYEQHARKRGPWRVLALIALLSGLVLALVYATIPGSGRLTDHTLLSWVHSSFQKLRSHLPPSLANDTLTTDQKVGRVTVTPPPSPASAEQDAPETMAVVVQPQMEEVQPGGTAQTTESTAEETMMSGPELELEELQQALDHNGLLVKRINGTTLKINLGTDAMFDFGSAEIKSNAVPALQKLADVMSHHDRMIIQVMGHTDSSGSAENNLHLSEFRAKVVADYLIGLGISEERIRSEGRGDSDTRLEEATRDQPELRRRVEIYLRPLQEW